MREPIALEPLSGPRANASRASERGLGRQRSRRSSGAEKTGWHLSNPQKPARARMACVLVGHPTATENPRDFEALRYLIAKLNPDSSSLLVIPTPLA